MPTTCDNCHKREVTRHHETIRKDTDSGYIASLCSVCWNAYAEHGYQALKRLAH